MIVKIEIFGNDYNRDFSLKKKFIKIVKVYSCDYFVKDAICIISKTSRLIINITKRKCNESFN